jgi:hypothetical protein
MAKNGIVNDVMFLTTPLDKVIQSVKETPSNGKPYIVLLAVGDFSPFTAMNISELEKAKQVVEESGFKVVGGYVSPSPVARLTEQSSSLMPIEERALLIEQTIQSSTWIHQDRWESYCNNSHISVTEVSVRLERFLNAHIETDFGIEVIFHFCGNDSSQPTIDVNEDKWSLQDVYAIRNDIAKSLVTTGITLDPLEVQDIIDTFKAIIGHAFNEDISIKELTTEHQEERAAEIVSKGTLPSLSMDVFVRGDANLDVCRLFSMSSMQLRSLAIVNRPNSLSLEEQVKNITPGEYILIEDDMPTGENTMKRVLELLNNKVIVKEMLILSHLDGNSQDTFYDIVDMRDFILGAKHGGLIVSLPNGRRVRAPYVLPYVSPASRARIPLRKEIEFSKQVLEMNQRFFECHPATLGQMDASFIELMKYIGYAESDSMLTIVNWHLMALQDL